MSKTLFLDIGKIQDKLEKSIHSSLYVNETFHLRLGLDKIKLSQNQLLSEDYNLPEYSFFYKISLEDILFLRTYFDQTNKLHQYWCEKMYRFLEFRLKTIKTRIQKNYPNKKDSVIFIQNVISFFLEQSLAQEDQRYLSIALKLLRNMSIAKVGKPIAQYEYNLVVANRLMTKL